MKPMVFAFLCVICCLFTEAAVPATEQPVASKINYRQMRMSIEQTTGKRMNLLQRMTLRSTLKQAMKKRDDVGVIGAIFLFIVGFFIGFTLSVLSLLLKPVWRNPYIAIGAGAGVLANIITLLVILL